MGAMHVEPSIAERRIRNLLDQRIRPAIYGPGSPLSVTAHHVEGEPIGVAEAERADYLPFAVGDPWGPSWGTSWFRFSGTVPKHLADRRVEAIIDLGFIRGQVGFNAEGLIWRAGAPLHGLHPERQWSLISQEARGGERVDLLVEAAANPFVNLNVVTDLGDLATAPTSPQYRLARAEVAPSTPRCGTWCWRSTFCFASAGSWTPAPARGSCGCSTPWGGRQMPSTWPTSPGRRRRREPNWLSFSAARRRHRSTG